MKHWMPDQVRHDGVGIFYCRFNALTAMLTQIMHKIKSELLAIVLLPTLKIRLSFLQKRFYPFVFIFAGTRLPKGIPFYLQPFR